MHSNGSQVYEETYYAKPLTVLIGLSQTENYLLTELSDQAQTVAPHLGRALTARIQQLTGANLTLPMSNTEMQFYLHDWFLQLFQSKDNGYLKFSESFLRLNQIVLLTGIDIILTYGHGITHYSPNPENATNAFNKALALKIASEQLHSQTNTAQYLYDMMLLD
jgi:hypothetical protein